MIRVVIVVTVVIVMLVVADDKGSNCGDGGDSDVGSYMVVNVAV